MYKVVN